MMRRFPVLLFVLCLFVSACGPVTPAGGPSLSATGSAPGAQTEATSSPVTPTASAPVSLLGVDPALLKGQKVRVWLPWYGIEATLFNSLAADFNAQNQWGIQVSAEGQTNFSNLYQSVTDALGTPDRPDLVIALPEHALEWKALGAVTDLSPYVSDPLFGLDGADMPPVFWSQDLQEGFRSAFPAQRTARFLLWNKSWAAELGFLSPPAAPEDFRQQACRAHQSMGSDALASNDAQGGWIVDTQPMTDLAWLLAFDGGALENGNYRFLAPHNIEALKFLRELSEQGCAWDAGETDPRAAFAGRQALFISAGLEDLPAVARDLAAAGSTDEWSVIPFPDGKDGISVVYGSSYVILNSDGPHQLAAWLFVRWLLEKEQDRRWVETTHLYPMRVSSLELLSDYKRSHPQWLEALVLLSRARVQPQLASWRMVKVMLGDGFAHMQRSATPSGGVALVLSQMDEIIGEMTK